MNQYMKAVGPISHKQVVLDAVTAHPNQSMQQIAKVTGFGYSTVRSCLRLLRAEGKVRQTQPRGGNSGATWAAGRDNVFLDNEGEAELFRPKTEFVAFRDPLHVALFGNPKQQPEGNKS